MAHIKTPFTDLFGQYGVSLAGRRCRDFEMNVVECLEAYGLRKGKKKCKDEIDDYNECTFALKQLKRVMEMEAERKRRWKNKERAGKEYYAPPPKIDSFEDVYQ
ncbi:NADH dehydrogenase [ubiquinone] iron-sulfur protein 5 [Centruroides vittatus]|uniref:NADH dehydrogenase [ubiquinone] iron-sulfur protein 5 n=1 Tax=Centruroides vittatus TaxID=120091 RepID=UPI003510569F